MKKRPPNIPDRGTETVRGNPEAWLEDFAAALGRPEENLPPGKGWVSMDALAIACGHTHATSNFKKRIGEMVAKKQLDRHDGTRYDPQEKRLVRRVTYRMNPPKKNA